MADLTNCRNLEHWIVERFSRFLLLIWRLTLNRFQMNRDIGRIRAELLYINTCPCLSGFIFNFIIMIIINTLLEKIQWKRDRQRHTIVNFTWWNSAGRFFRHLQQTIQCSLSSAKNSLLSDFAATFFTFHFKIIIFMYILFVHGVTTAARDWFTWHFICLNTNF